MSTSPAVAAAGGTKTAAPALASASPLKPTAASSAAAAAAAAAAKKKANNALVSPFANIRMGSGLGLIADATRQAAAKTNPDAAKSQDAEGLLTAVKYDARKLASASFKTTVLAVVLTPSVSIVKPRPAVGGKKPFPGFAQFSVIVIGPPGAKGNSVGLKTPGNSLAPHGRIAYLEAQTVEVTGFNEETQKKTYKQKPSAEKAVLAEGALIEVKVIGQLARPTHNRDGSEVPEKTRATQPELKPDDVVALTLDEITLRAGGNLQAKAIRIQLRGTATECFGNEVTKALAEAMQRPFKPLVLSPDFDWTKIKVERKKKSGEAADGGAAPAAAAAAPADEANGGGGDANVSDDTAGDKPSNDKVQVAGASCMLHESALALWTNYIVGTLGTPQDTIAWREAAGQPALINGSPVFDPSDSTQWTKKAKEGEPAPKPGEPVAVQIRFTVPVQQFVPLTPVQVSSRSVMLSQTVPQLLLPRFGISDPDYQPFIRMLVPNGVFAMMASPMTAGWMMHQPADDEEFSQAFYPRMNYVGDKGNKTADVKSAAFYVDHAATLLNACVPVTREFVVMLMLIMQQYVSKTRYNFDMTSVKKAARKDSMGRQIEDNFLETRIDETGTQAVVNVFECQFNVVKELTNHAFYVLIENIGKNNEIVQRVFAERGDHAPAYFSAMLLQALAARYNIADLSKPLAATEQLLKQAAEAIESGAAMDMNDPLSEDYVRPKGSPSLKAMLSKTVEVADREAGTVAGAANPRYIGDNALQLDAEDIKAFRLLPWAISLNHLAQRGLPVVYAGVAAHYDVIYPRVKEALDSDENLMPLDKMIEMRRKELEPLMEAERKRREAALSAHLSADEEAALDQAEAAMAVAAVAAAVESKKRTATQLATGTTTTVVVVDTPKTPQKAGGAGAGVGILKKKLAGSVARPLNETAAASSALTAVLTSDGLSDAKRTRRALPVSFSQVPDVQAEGEEDVDEEDAADNGAEAEGEDDAGDDGTQPMQDDADDGGHAPYTLDPLAVDDDGNGEYAIDVDE